MNILPSDIFLTYFSPHTPHAIEYNSVVYPTVEHAYHCQRYLDRSITEEIRNARSPYKAWEISQKYKRQQLPNFNDRKRDIMKEISRAKMRQHEDIQQALLISNDQRIVKHI